MRLINRASQRDLLTFSSNYLARMISRRGYGPFLTFDVNLRSADTRICEFTKSTSRCRYPIRIKNKLSGFLLGILVDSQNRLTRGMNMKGAHIECSIKVLSLSVGNISSPRSQLTRFANLHNFCTEQISNFYFFAFILQSVNINIYQLIAN